MLERDGNLESNTIGARAGVGEHGGRIMIAIDYDCYSDTGDHSNRQTT